MSSPQHSPNPRDDDRRLGLPRGELERLADGVIPVVRDEGQRQHRHRHGYVLRRK